jgi:hypothetical protein
VRVDCGRGVAVDAERLCRVRRGRCDWLLLLSKKKRHVTEEEASNKIGKEPDCMRRFMGSVRCWQRGGRGELLQVPGDELAKDSEGGLRGRTPRVDTKPLLQVTLLFSNNHMILLYS